MHKDVGDSLFIVASIVLWGVSCLVLVCYAVLICSVLSSLPGVLRLLVFYGFSSWCCGLGSSV